MKQTIERKITTETLYRTARIDSSISDEESRSFELSFSSEEPYERWFGTEVLGHKSKEIDMDWLKSGTAPLLSDHAPDTQIGVVERAWVDGKKGRAVVRFGKNDLAEEVFQDVKDGIKSNISVGYVVKEMKLISSEDNHETYRVTKWSPLEISVVSIPADKTVGIGRSEQKQKHKTIIFEEVEMDKKEESKSIPDVPKVDEKAIRAEIAKKEMDRIKEITALGETHNMKDLGMDAIKSGVSVDEFRADVLAKLAEKGMKPVETPNAELGMTEKEVKQFSFLRAIRAMANPNDHQAQKEAAFEFEASAEVSKKMGRAPKGLYVPFDVLKRDLSAGIDTAGGYTVADDLLTGSFIETLENAMVVRQLGATVLTGLVGDISIPKQTGGATGYWLNEGGSPTESQQTFGQLQLTPKTVGAYTDYTRKLMQQSSISVENFVRNDLALRLALQMDAKAYNGTGASGEPRGILETSGIGEVTLNATNAPDWGDIVDLETAVAVDNALTGTLAYVSTATIQGAMKQTVKASSTNAQFILDGDMLNGYPFMMSNQVPAKYIIFGNWRELILAFWGGLDINVDTSTLSTSGGTRVVALQDVDIAVRHAESFARGYKV